MILGSVCLENLFLALYFEVKFVFDFEVCFLHATEGWIWFSDPFFLSVSFYWEIESIDIEILMIMTVNSCYFVVGGGGSVCV